MLELTPEKILETRHQWGSLARDLVLAVTPQPLGVTPKLADILDTYNLSMEGLLGLMAHPPFRALLKAETGRVKQLGGKGGLIIRFESMLAAIGERLFLRFSNTAAPEATKDMLGFFKLLMQASGVGQEPAPVLQNSNQTVVQFTIPEIQNPKLEHLRSKAVGADD